MYKSFNYFKLSIMGLIAIVVFIAIYTYYFWLSYTAPLLKDDFTIKAGVLMNNKVAGLYSNIIYWSGLNYRIGLIVDVIINYYNISYHWIIPLIHITNLILGYSLVKGVNLNICNLHDIKNFIVIFMLYTFLNSAPFQGIVWPASTISNNFGFIFVLLFFNYLRKIITSGQNINTFRHVLGFASAYLAGWSQENVPAHILVSAIFLCFYLYTNGIQIINYLCNKKIILIAYLLTALGWVSHAIAVNFWSRRLVSFTDLWEFYEDIRPVPTIIKILLLVVIILLIYYFINRKNLSEKDNKTMSFVFILTMLNLLTCLVNIRTWSSRAFFYHSFIAAGILFYIYINFIANNKKIFINKIAFIIVLYVILNCGYLLAYNTLLEKYRSNYIFKILNEKNNQTVVTLPSPFTIPSELFFSKQAIKLESLAIKNTYLLHKLSENPYGWSKDHLQYIGFYLKRYYPGIKKLNYMSYQKFVNQN